MQAARPPWGEPTTASQLPSRPGTSQASHCAAQREPQQTPSTQKPVAHSPSRAQLDPAGSSGSQSPPAQKRPAAHSASCVQAPTQAEGPHSNGAQSFVSSAGQLPAPSQLAARTASPAVQLGGRQVVAAPGKEQEVLCVPLHRPLQSDPSPAQAARGATGWPATAVQTPRLPASAQASHCPAQAWLQHAPSAQWPVAHSLSAVQSAPGVPFATQEPPLHQWVDTQSASVAQLVAQAVAPQR